MHANTHTYICTCVRECVYIHIYVRACVYIYMCVETMKSYRKWEHKKKLWRNEGIIINHTVYVDARDANNFIERDQIIKKKQTITVA